MQDIRLRGLRGAITVQINTREAIVEGTKRLLTLLIGENGLREEDLVSIIFTVTPDLTAAFPAEAARELGLTVVPLLCTTEIPVPGALRRCVRILLHAYSHLSQKEVKHIYLEEAVKLRPDLQYDGDEEKY